MGARYDELKTAYTRAAIIAVSMMGSVLVYVVIAELLRNLSPPWKGVVFTPAHQYYEYIRYGLLAFGLVTVLLAAKISAAVNLSPEKLINPAPALITHVVILSATCDMVGTFGFVLFLMAGNITDAYIFAGLSLGLSLIFFPRFSRWTELAGSWLASPGAEPDGQPEQQGVKPTTWKAWIIFMGVLMFMFGANALYRDNALEESYSLLLWVGFFPITVIALLYLFCIVAPRSAREKGRELECRPWIWYPAGILFSLFFGLLLVFPARGTLAAFMDWLNKTPTQVESIITGLGRSNHCRMKVDLAGKCSICLQYLGRRPVQTPWPLENMSADELHRLNRKRVILVGRKSFAGTVIDEIRLPPGSSIEPTSSDTADRTK